MGPYALERFVEVAEMTKAEMVYADYDEQGAGGRDVGDRNIRSTIINGAASVMILILARSCCFLFPQSVRP